MYSNKEIKENLEVVSAIGDITGIYQEIASLRIKQMREGVAKTKEFLAGVADVYNRAKASYIATLQKAVLKGKTDYAESAFIKRNGKKVFILLSANEHLYGTLILDIWRLFTNELRREEADAVIIGSVGKYFARSEQLTAKATYFFLDDDKPATAQIKKITDFISSYEQIVVYSGEMVTVLSQIPSKSVVSGGATLGEKVEEAKNYLFEPTPAKILEFFETEIIAALFNQKIFEHQLARFAARMVAMDQATENSKETLEQLNKEFRALRRSVSNRKQLEAFAGYQFWIKEKREEES
jgi:F-type H+-transporting ATPase subunit gamma